MFWHQRLAVWVFLHPPASRQLPGELLGIDYGRWLDWQYPRAGYSVCQVRTVILIESVPGAGIHTFKDAQKNEHDDDGAGTGQGHL